MNVFAAVLCLALFVSSLAFAETIQKKGAFGTNDELKLIEKTYVESLGGVAADIALARVAEFARTIEGANVKVLEAKDVGAAPDMAVKKLAPERAAPERAAPEKAVEVRATGKMRCKMPWSFGASIESEFQFELAVKAIGNSLSIVFSRVLVSPRHPDLPQGIEKFVKACLDPSRDALMKVVGK